MAASRHMGQEHENRLRDLARELEALTEARAAGRAALAEAAKVAHDAGMSVYRIAQVTGVSQPGVRKWLD